jgi:hypothetical protein
MHKPAAVVLACMLAGVAPCANACDATQPARPIGDVEAFLSGDWSGAGEFASGKAIAADVSFRPVAGGAWLAYSHADRAPGRYRAEGTWGYTRAGDFVMTLHDSGGGARVFASEGWCGDGVVFDLREDLSAPSPAAASTARERFVFERIAGNRLKMTYLRGGAENEWRMVDFVVFDRKMAPDQARP